MDPNDITTGFTLVGFAALCFSVGFMVKGQSRMLEIQAHMLKALSDLTQVIAGGQQRVEISQGNWREMPTDAQLMMRQALVQLLAEMDRELPSRH
jgi:hypothetical protein